MKRIGAFIFSVIVLIGCIGVSAADDRVTIGNIDVQTNGVNTTVTANVLSKPAGKSAVLVAAYMHSETGRILSVNAAACDDVSLLTDDTLTVTLADKTADGGVLSYNVWDSLAGNMSLLNNSPTAPTGLSATETVSGAEIRWGGALDDYDSTDSLRYNVYDDGLLVKENLSELQYTAKNLADGAFYNFEVCAVDSEGKKSEAGEIGATTLTKNAALTTDAYTQSADGNVEFTGTLTDDTKIFYATRALAGGLDCYATTLRPRDSAGTYLTYKFADNYFQNLQGCKAIFCELTYFDEGTDRVQIQIFLTKTGGTETQMVSVKKTDTGTWRTARIYYALPENTYFAKNMNDGNGYFNFRLNSSATGAAIKVRKFSVYPIFDTTAKTDEYYTLKKNSGSYFTADGGTVVCDLTTNMAGLTPSVFGKRTGIKLSSLSGGSATFAVTDSELNTGNVKVLLTYYAPDEGTTITLNGVEKSVTTSGKWRKMSFDITKIGSSNYTISSNKDIAINAIRVIAAD